MMERVVDSTEVHRRVRPDCLEIIVKTVKAKIQSEAYHHSIHLLRVCLVRFRAADLTSPFYHR